MPKGFQLNAGTYNVSYRACTGTSNKYRNGGPGDHGPVLSEWGLAMASGHFLG